MHIGAPSSSPRAAAAAGEIHSRGSGSSKRQKSISRILVSAEIALSLVLLIGAGLLMRSFWHLLEVRPGFEPHQLVISKIWLPFPNDPTQDAYRAIEKRGAYYREVRRRIGGLAGVEQVAIGTSDTLPMNGSARRRTRAFSIEGRAEVSERAPAAELAAVSSAYFDVLKTPLRRGRVFTEGDNSTSQPVAVINEALQRQYWKDLDPIGQRIKLLGSGSVSYRGLKELTIVGVVGDIRSDGVDVQGAPYLYVSEGQAPPYDAVIYLRTAGDPGALGEAIRREVQSVDPTIPVFNTQTMNDVVAKSLAARRFALEILGIFAAVAFLLACIGIYGVMAYTISQRTGEIGLRMALGAQQSDILKVVLGDAALIVIAGVGTGLIGAAILTRFLRALLFEVEPTDPATFGALTIVLACVALLASFIPARRASRIDPLAALRYE